MQSAANTRVATGDPGHDEQQRRAAVLGKRKERVAKSVTSLANQYCVPVAVFSPGVDSVCLPSKPEVMAIATRYNALPAKDRTKQFVHAASHLEDLQSAAAAKLAKGGGVVGDMPVDELRVLLRSLDKSLAAASDRIRKTQPKTVEEIDQELMLKYADKFMVDSQDDVGADADDSGSSIVSSKKSSLVCENPMVQSIAEKPKQPEYSAEETKRMKELVQSIAEKPKAYTPRAPAKDRNGVPYYERGIGYVNFLGEHMIERDAFDFTRYDLGMPPPSLEPDLLDDDHYYVQLWPWSSLPLPIPPPP